VEQLNSSPTTYHIAIIAQIVQEERQKIKAPALLEEHAQIAVLNVILVLRAITVHGQVAVVLSALLVLFKVDTERILANLAH
jgi:hypothetical protein